MKNKQLGFSLLELIVVIGIIAILSGGVLYSFSKLQTNSSLEKSLTDMKSALTQSRESVRKGNCKTMLFTFDTNNKKVTCHCEDAVIPDLVVSAPSNFGFTTSVNQSASFKLTNNGLGGLSVISVAPSSLNLNTGFTLKISKQSEYQSLELNQTKILYAPF